MSELDIWQYWEGPLPGYVELCLETVRRQHPDVRLLDRASFDAIWETDRDVPIDSLGVHHRADFVRAYLLQRSGGMWLDSDFVALRPLSELTGLPDGKLFAAYRQDGDQFANGLMVSRPGDPVVVDLYARVCDHLRAGRPIDWLEIGAYALNPAIEAHHDVVHELDAMRVCPIPWHQMRRFEEPGDASSLADGSRWGVMLSNASASADLRQRSRDEMLVGSSLLSDLLRRALSGN